MENIEWILAHEGADSKALFWAQNGHVHDGLVNTYADAIGQQLRKKFGDRYFAIGTGAFYAYRHDDNRTGDWRMQRHEVTDIDPTTLNHCLDQIAEPNVFIDFRAARRGPALAEYLRQNHKMMAGAGSRARKEKTEYQRVGTLFDGLICLRESSPVNFLEK